MLRKTSLVISLIIICFLTLTCISAQDNVTDDIISHDIDTPTISNQPAGNFTELSRDIADAGDTLELDRDYKYVAGDSVSSNGITIDKSITINGNGHTIDASNKVGIFSVTASNVIFKNITFLNANSQDYISGGAAISTSGENTKVENCNFTNCNSQAVGGAIKSSATGLTIDGSNFDSCSSVSGSGIRVEASNARITNSNFTNNNARIGGGAISIIASDAFIDNCVFENNIVLPNYIGDGGAITINTAGRRTTIQNSVFKSNSATGGGAINIAGARDVSIYNSYFENNSAVKHGGAVLTLSMDCNIENSLFVNNTAVSGAGVYMGYSEIYITQYAQNQVKNSTFIDNYANYGGGAITATGWSIIRDSSFYNNSAGSYGGAVDLTNSELINSVLENNSAVFGGALYIQSSWVDDSKFINNSATVGNSIYIINWANLNGNDVLDEDIYTFTQSDGQISGNDHDIRHMLQTDDGYYAYCAEKYNSAPYYGVYDHSMEKLLNSINHQPVTDYLKILIYQYLDHINDLKDSDFHDYVWAFTDDEYWNSQDPVVREVIGLYDAGFRVPSVNACKVLRNGTLMYFNFSSMITPSGQQNLFLFKYWYGDIINETLTKEALNKTAYIGDYIEYRIVVSNKGTSVVYDIWVEDKDYSKGLVYESWHPEIGNWSYDNQTGHWKLDKLEAGKSASLILKFKVADYGKLYNNATSGVGNINVTNSTDDIYVYTPNFTVQKISLNQTVELGEKTEFEILLNNTGDFDLNEVFVEELSYDGLEYVSWYENSHWKYSYVNGKHRWTFNGIFPKGEISAFIVIFRAKEYGNHTNIVVAGSNETDNKTGNNTTKVLKPDFVVEKHVLTPYVMVGNQTIFQIIVKNTGDIDLNDIVVIEDSYNGLIFDHAVTGDIWVPTTVNAKKAWRLNSTLAPDSEEFFFVVFNATHVGNFTNFVVATSNKTGNRTGNNTTHVNDTIPKEGNYSNFTVEKITIDTEVLLGEIVEFQIIVKNTGNATIHNLTIYETKYDGLTYHDYHDHFDLWEFNRDKMSWTLKDDFYPGEELGIHVFFNTTRVGTFTNCVVVTSNETDNKTGNNTTKVLKPAINVEKISINRTVEVGQQVMFEIVVHNCGETDLKDVIVHESNFEGLVYDSFIDNTGFWQKNNDLSWSLNRILAKGEYEGFFVVFNSTKRGNFTNTVVVESDGTENDTDNDTVSVLDYNLTVSKNTITKKVKVGEYAVFEIVVRNTGDLVLKDVFVIESSYDSGLEYLDYISGNGNWKHSLDVDGRHRFTLLDDLDVGDFASFRVIFKTIAVGNFTNTVEAGFNNTTCVNSTNTTEVVNVTTPANRTNITLVPGVIIENFTRDDEIGFESPDMDEKATGNPLLALLLALILIPSRRFRK